MHDTFKCKYCSTLFKEPRTGTIVCPNCGAPDPTRIVPEVYQRVVETYIPVSTPTGNYYRNPQPSRSEWVYDTFGYKATIASVLVVVIAFSLWAFYWLSFRYDNISKPDPNNISKVPTSSIMTPTEVVYNDPYVDIVWLTNDEFSILTKQENTINLVQLKNGQAIYAKQVSSTFNESVWQMTRPLGVSDVTISSTNNTAVNMKINGYWYNINIYQPFVIAGLDSLIFIVDKDGQIWMKNFSMQNLVSLEVARSSIPMTINPNENLTPTY